MKKFRQQESIDTFQWPAMSPGMNTIEHIWEFIGRTVNQCNPQCQNIAQLANAILVERLKLRCLIRGMNRLVRQLWCKRGGYARY